MIIQSGNPKMNQKNNTLKPRTQHNADAAYYVGSYLQHSFPTQLYEPFTDSEGNLSSRPVYRDGQPVDIGRRAFLRHDVCHLDALIRLGRAGPAGPVTAPARRAPHGRSGADAPGRGRAAPARRGGRPCTTPADALHARPCSRRNR